MNHWTTWSSDYIAYCMNGYRPVAKAETLPTEEVKEGVIPEDVEEEDLEDVKKRSRKPPSNGKCRVCGEVKPLNRSKICYSCWVAEENGKNGWEPGNPHPGNCGCDLDCAQDKNSFGN